MFNLSTLIDSILISAKESKGKDVTVQYTTRFEVYPEYTQCSWKTRRIKYSSIALSKFTYSWLHSEAWFTNDIADAEMYISGYKINRYDRQKGLGGGIAVYIK